MLRACPGAGVGRLLHRLSVGPGCTRRPADSGRAAV